MTNALIRNRTHAHQPCHDTAHYYCTEDLPSAGVPGTRLQNILDALRVGKPISEGALLFLTKQSLGALHQLASRTILYDSFRELALAEQKLRMEASRVKMLAREAADRAIEAELQAESKLASEQEERESRPKHIAKVRNQALRAKYGIEDYVEQHCFGQLIRILKNVDAGQRMEQEDFVWLSSVGESYFSTQLRNAYHRIEADYLVDEFKQTRDPWRAANASSHLRKCNRSSDAAALLATIEIDQQKTPMIQSALYTTYGGVMRDLGRSMEALRLGNLAHALSTNDYRPCTLLGAIHTESGDFRQGQEWYAKAVERGATIASVDQDVRSIFFRADVARRAAMKEFLLREDPIRFAWTSNESRHRR